MGSQTHIASPKAPVPESNPGRSKAEAEPDKSGSTRRRKRILTPPEPGIRPAFLMNTEFRGDNEDTAPKSHGNGGASEERGRQTQTSGRTRGTGTKRKSATKTASVRIVPNDPADPDAISSDELETRQYEADAVTGGLSGSEELSDPDLIVLLEQLSETIDTANQVLSETPAAAAIAVTNEYAAVNEPPAPGRPTPPPITEMLKRRSGTGLATLTAAGLAVLVGAVGSVLWFKDNPWLLDGMPTRGMTATTVQDSGQIMVPAVGVPLPARKPPAAGTATRTASLGQNAVVPTLPPAPEVTGTADTEASTTSATGSAGQPIDLGLTIPEHSRSHQVSVMIRGVPEEAQLSAGSKIGGGTWVLEEKDLTRLTLVTPPSFPARALTLDVLMLKSDGKIPESRSIVVVVQPTRPAVAPAAGKTAPVEAAKPPVAAAAVATVVAAPQPGATTVPRAKAAQKKRPALRPQLSAEEEARFLKRGEELLQLGDVASARLVLEHAARRDSKPAMTALAKTYDPEHLARIGVRGVKPDIDQANAWYERASRKVDR